MEIPHETELASVGWPGIPDPMSAPEEEVLAGGNMAKVVRIGTTVHRSAGAWTPTVHALLELNPPGFDGDPGYWIPTSCWSACSAA